MKIVPALVLFIFCPLILIAQTNILIFGDSNSVKLSNEYTTWTYLLEQNFIDNPSVNIYNYALAESIIDYSQRKLDQALLEIKPSIIFLCTGIFNAIHSAPINDIKKQLNQLIATAVKSGAIVIVGRIDISCWIPVFQWDPSYISQFNVIFPDLLEKYSKEKYPIYSFNFLNTQNLACMDYNLGDFLHPNSAGHYLIYSEVKHLLDQLSIPSSN